MNESIKEKFGIYDGILEQLKAFLERAPMFARSVEATYATFVTLIRCLDIVADSPAGESLVTKHRKFMTELKNPGCLAYPNDITQDELVEHFRDFYKTHIVIPVPGAPFTPEEQEAFLKEMPTRQEIEVLGPDERKDLELGWIVNEKVGIGVTNKEDK